tara:strand:- start:372 stop:752 length:381 start_codon:yes stop_codon:yes gene_type:complete
MSFLRHGNDYSRADDWDDHCFEVEEVLQLVRWREHEWKLYAPEDEVSDHFLGGYTSTFREVIWDVEKGREDGPDYLEGSKLAGGVLMLSGLMQDHTWNIAVLPVQVWIACQNNAVAMRTTMAKREK